MNLENLISNMMTINVTARLWHWTTDIAQHHVTYEQFLNQNQVLTDSMVESALGNDKKIDFSKVGVTKAIIENYSHEAATNELREYRDHVFKMKNNLQEAGDQASQEIITILDGVTELASKTLYLLKLK